MTIDRLTLTKPDDWHIHLRDGAALARTVRDCAKQFSRALCMPNLVPPVTTTAEAQTYRQRIMAHVPAGNTFNPRMALYLTDVTSPSEVTLAVASGIVQAFKYYPAGATTNSHAGVTHISTVYGVLEQMAEQGLVLCLHGEVTHTDVDIFDREKRFIDETLLPLVARFPTLKIVLEHITTSDAASFVREQSAHIAATITPQHLLFNRNHMLVGGIRPHLFCLPILKRQSHQQALIEAATSGNPKYFLGTDSAPHAQDKKENACGCAGCYSAPYALSLYAESFEDAGKLDKLEGFASHFGADFYGVTRNTAQITLIRQAQTIAQSLPYLDNGQIIPLRFGETLRWQILESQHD